MARLLDYQLPFLFNEKQIRMGCHTLTSVFIRCVGYKERKDLLSSKQYKSTLLGVTETMD